MLNVGQGDPNVTVDIINEISMKVLTQITKHPNKLITYTKKHNTCIS